MRVSARPGGGMATDLTPDTWHLIEYSAVTKGEPNAAVGRSSASPCHGTAHPFLFFLILTLFA
jgi:hypothetical protein